MFQSRPDFHLEKALSRQSVTGMESDLLEQLHHPEVFPEPADDVEVIQTHLSVVCLTEKRVYKFKKPVRFDFVDYSTLERRKHFCEEEVRLNRRLCPRVYLGTVPLRRLENGSLRLGGKGQGEVIEYAVEMTRLPADRMLDCLLKTDAASAADIREIAIQVAAFHKKAERSAPVNEAGAPAKLREFALANFEETRSGMETIFHSGLHQSLEQRTLSDFDRLLPVLERRLTEGKIVDGHGDLHARNICLSDPLAIYDCIEFNAGFRCSDIALENAFLVMDLGFRGHPELALVYLDTYIGESGDGEQRELMPALVRYRAMVRAKVSAIAAAEPELNQAEKDEATRTGRSCLHYAAASAIAEDGPWLIIACGLPGSGKSFTFQALSEETGWRVFSSDRVRKELAGAGPDDRLDDSFYSKTFSEKTYRELTDRAAKEARSHGVAMIDANFRTATLRDFARSRAAGEGMKLAIVQVDTAEEVIVKRLATRPQDDTAASDADLAVYQKLKSEFQPPAASEAEKIVVIDGTATREQMVPEVLLGLL